MDTDIIEDEVGRWMLQCFNEEIANDKTERNYRFLEEALELVQACSCTREDAHKLVDYVFDRPVGGIKEECGGVMVTLAALCNAHKMTMAYCAILEIARINKPEIMDKIRIKQANKLIKSDALP